VPIILVSTSNHIGDVQKAYDSLGGRIAYLNIKFWECDELQEIVDKGFDALKVKIDKTLSKIIGDESVGLPQVTQQLCRNLFYYKGFEEIIIQRENDILISDKDLHTTFHRYVSEYLTVYNSYYKVLIEQNTEGLKFLNIKKNILELFEDDPIKSSMTINLLISKFKSLKVDGMTIPTEIELISVVDELVRISQEKNMNLVEWIPSQKRICINDPLFLFFLRWKNMDRGIQRMMRRIEDDLNIDEALEDL